MLEQLPADPDPDEFPRTDCGCGLEIVFTPDGWQHNVAPYFWGNDHDPDPDTEAQAEALRYIVDHCEHRPDDLPEPGDRCKDCGIEITWLGGDEWEPAVGAIPWRDDGASLGPAGEGRPGPDA